MACSQLAGPCVLIPYLCDIHPGNGNGVVDEDEIFCYECGTLMSAEWEQMFDPSGKPYYVNHKLKTTQWHLPTPTDNHGTPEETKVQSVEVADLHSSVQARSPPFLILLILPPPP